MKLFKKKKDVELTFKTSKTQVGAVLRLFNSYFIRSFIGPFFAFVFPLLIYLILGSLMDKKLVFAGCVAMAGMGIGTTNLPVAIVELKSSILLKRIGASPVKSRTFTLVIIFYYSIVITIATFWLMLWAVILDGGFSALESLGSVHGFFAFFYGSTINGIFSISLGFAISSVSKSVAAAQGFGMMIYFPFTFLSGMFISPDVIAGNDIMLFISRLIPARYTTMYLSESWYGDSLKVTFENNNVVRETVEGNPFLIHDYSLVTMEPLKIQEVISSNFDSTVVGTKTIDSVENVIMYSKIDHIIAYVYPFVSLALITVVSTMKFKWTTR